MRCRRIGPVAMVLFLVAAFGLAGASSAGTAAAAPDRAAANASSRWLARQLSDDGTLRNPLGGTLPDHGLMIDTLFALHAAGDGMLATPIADYLDGHAEEYFTWEGLIPGQGYDAIIVGGAAAKVLVAVEVAGRDPRNFGGYDMVAETKAAIPRTGRDAGRISDYSKNPDLAGFVSNNSNMFGQALAVIGLAGVDEYDQLALDTLVTQQCTEGYFRIFFSYTAAGDRLSTCDEGKASGQASPDGDATGLALSALLAARRAGAPGLDAPISQAVQWLKANQTAGGGWGGGVGTAAPNTNSTGLIVQALAEAGGATTEVDKGVVFLKSAQATTEVDSANSLAEHIGAIAYDPAAYQAARTGGITGLDTWIRASAQASLGLSQVGFHDLTHRVIPEDPGQPPGTENPPPGPNPGPAPGAAPSAGGPPVSNRAGTPSPPRDAKKTTVVTSPPVSQARPGSATPSGRLGQYLAGQLVDGDHVEVVANGKQYVDYDVTADLVLALHILGEQPEAVEKATRFLLHPDSVEAYAHGAPYEQDEAAYAQPLAKLTIIAGFARLPEADRLRDELLELRTGEGEFLDTGTFADTNSVHRHSWALAATAGTDDPDNAAALDRLISDQCADGTFPNDLDTKGCASGDLAATAAAVTALNAVPADTDAVLGAGLDDEETTNRASRSAPSTPPRDAVPDGWPEKRTTALAAAAAALNAAPDPNGTVPGSDGDVDVALSAVVAAGRQTAGLDASDTARSLGELLRADGGLTRPSATESDLETSIAAAPGVAGRAWTSADGSPVLTGVRLPLVTGKDRTPAVAVTSNGLPRWVTPGLIALGAALAFAAGFGLRQFTHRRTATHKGKSS